MNRWITRDKSYYVSLITLAVPVALQGLITFLVSFADNWMVNTLGDAAVSGVYMGSQIQTLIQMFTSGVSGAILIISAQYWGRRETAQIRMLVSIGVKASIIVGALFGMAAVVFPRQIIDIFTDDAATLNQGEIYMRWVGLSYVFFCVSQALIAAMRSVEVTRIGMWSSLASLMVNLALNYVLIFGRLGFAPMGVKGAAIATVISRIVETGVILGYVLARDKKLGFRLSDLKLSDSGLLRDFLKYGAPLVAGEIVWAVNMMCNTVIMGGYGAEVVSAVSVANTLNTMAFIAINGLASAVGIITGKTIGAGRTDLVKEYARTTQLLFLGVGVFSGLLLLAARLPFLSLYTGISAAAMEEAKRLTLVLCVMIVGTSYQMPCLFGLVKSGGDISFVFRNDTIFVFLVVLPSAFVAAHFGAPAWVTFACLKCDQILKCFVAAVKINRFNWIKNLTRKAAR